MLTPETVSFMEAGCSLIVGTVSPDGEPHVTRAWAVTFTSDEPVEVRLLLDADDAIGIAHLAAEGKVAVTAGDVQTLESIQLKGTALGVEPATDADRARSFEWRDGFFANVTAIDGTPRAMLEHLSPRDVVACRVRVAELFDQTPGPGAGASMPADAS